VSSDTGGIDLALAEATCLAVIATAPAPLHGWALVKDLAPGGPLGRIWSLSRPLTYRAIDQLTGADLVVRHGEQRGKGADRRLLGPTPSGTALASRWLASPVVHLRDVRTELLLKLALCERAGRSTGPLVSAQLEVFGARFVQLVEGDEPGDLVARWRRAQATSILAFLGELRDDLP
jgi:PadR family transcriptional regulator AphA